MRLTFSAPADDGHLIATGPAAAYDLRWSERPIDGESWTQAQSVAPLPAPKSPGLGELVILEGMPPAAIRYFILRAIDDSGLAGAWSDEVAIDTRAGVDEFPPATVQDLHARYRAASSQALALQAEAPQAEGVIDLIDGDERTGWLQPAQDGQPVRFTFSIGDEARPLTRVRVLPHFLFPGDFPTDIRVVVTDPQTGEERIVASKAGHRAEPGGWLQLDLPPTAVRELHLDVTRGCASA